MPFNTRSVPPGAPGDVRFGVGVGDTHIGQQAHFQTFHDSRLLRVFMIMAQQVQDPVDHQVRGVVG